MGSAESKDLRFDSSWDSEFFMYHARDKTKKTFYLILFTNTFYVGHQMERYFRRACQVPPWTTVGYFFCNLGKNLSWHLYYLCYSF